MNNKLMLYISIVLFSLWHMSFQWPLKEGKMTSSFGESRADHFHDGIDMSSNSNSIYPVDSGKLLYYWDKTIFPLDIYPGGGNYKILKHNKNIFSVYMHLEDGSQVKNLYSTNDSLGKIGNTGHSFAAHLHFSILDQTTRISHNPLTLLPPYKDTKSPKIANILVRIKDKYIRIRDKSNIRLTKHYPLLIEIADSANSKEKMGIYKLDVTHGTKKIASMTFEKIEYATSGLSINAQPYDNVFDEKGYYKISPITYIAGENTIIITASDYSGNKTEESFSFDVKLDLK